MTFSQTPFWFNFFSRSFVPPLHGTYKEAALNAGMNDYLLKPVKLSEILESIKNFVGKKAA
jgi:CheY-like chemotaxis protein